MKALDLEALRHIFADKRLHIAVGKITKSSVISGRASLRCFVSIWPEEREIVAMMTTPSSGPNSGLFSFPVPGDLVIVVFADGDPDQAFVVSRLTSKEDTIPQTAVDGATVLRALLGKKLWLTSNTRINLSVGDAEPAENLVLGQVFKTMMSFVLGQLADQADKLKQLSDTLSIHTHAGNLGYPTSPPNEAADFITKMNEFDVKKTNFEEQKASPVDDELILSDLAFTEKG